MQIPVNISARLFILTGERKRYESPETWWGLDTMFLACFIMTTRPLGLQLIFGHLFFPAKKFQFVFSCQFLPPNTLTVKPGRAHVLQRPAQPGPGGGSVGNISRVFCAAMSAGFVCGRGNRRRERDQRS